MSVDQTDVVDAIGTDPTSGAVVLTIFDHLPWEDIHLWLLKEKVKSYLGFLASGDVYRTYPGAAGRKFEISLALLHRPDEAYLTLLQQIEVVVTSAGYVFRFGPLPSGYAT